MLKDEGGHNMNVVSGSVLPWMGAHGVLGGPEPSQNGGEKRVRGKVKNDGLRNKNDGLRKKSTARCKKRRLVSSGPGTTPKIAFS